MTNTQKQRGWVLTSRTKYISAHWEVLFLLPALSMNHTPSLSPSWDFNPLLNYLPGSSTLSEDSLKWREVRCVAEESSSLTVSRWLGIKLWGVLNGDSGGNLRRRVGEFAFKQSLKWIPNTESQKPPGTQLISHSQWKQSGTEMFNSSAEQEEAFTPVYIQPVI